MSSRKVISRGSYGSIIEGPNPGEVTKVPHSSHWILGRPDVIEIDITSRLRHPNLLASSRRDPNGNLIFPRFDSTLADPHVLDLPMDQRLHLVDQAIAGLSALHQAGYVHLDIKPDNLLVMMSSQHLVIADFSSAMLIGDASSVVSHRNRLIDDQKPPEILSMMINGSTPDTWIYSRATDYWCLGLVCALVISGRSPMYRLTTRLDLLAQACHVQEALPEHLRCLVEVDPLNRHLPLHGVSRHVQTRPQPTLHSSLDLHGIPNRSRAWWSRFIRLQAEVNGDESIAGMMIASRLLLRLDDEAAQAAYWIGVKIASGRLVDPRDLFEEPDIPHLCRMELEIIRIFDGCLHSICTWTPNMSTNGFRFHCLDDPDLPYCRDRRLRDYANLV